MRCLEGIRVLDISNVIAGPYAASIMGEFGAEVIKVEMPGKGDTSRLMGPLYEGKSERWPTLGRNKKCVTLDLHQPEGKELFFKLVEKSDVVIENFRTGTIDKWGIGVEEMKKRNPDIIVTHVTGYGQTGPYRENSGYGTPVTAFSGVTYCQGFPDRPPVNITFSLADYTAGLYAVIGTMFALYCKKVNNGPSQEVDVSLYEGLFRMQESLIADYYFKGKVKERTPVLSGSSCPSGVFETKDHSYVVLVCTGDNVFQYLAQTMERPDLAEKYALTKTRLEDADTVNSIVREWIKEHDCKDLIEKCKANKVAIDKIYSVKDIFEDPHYAFRKNIVEVEDPTFGKIVQPSVTPVLTETPGEIRWSGQLMGQSNKEIYGDFLGLSEETLNEYKEKGII